MNLFEYQAKEAFRDCGIATPKGVLVRSVEELDAACAETGFPCVLKSQVLRGGRGKAGLIKVVKDMDEAKSTADALFKSEHNVRMLLVEEAVSIARELYLSITIEPASGTILMMGCAEGGVDIEGLAATNPEKIIRVNVDIAEGLGAYHVNNMLFGLGLAGDEAKKVGAIIRGLYKVFRTRDAQLAEINPIFITTEGDVIAGDGKLIIDDNSLFRQPNYPRTRDYFDSDVEFEAAEDGSPYICFGGDIALLCAGSGLTTTVFDLVRDFGGSVATYVDFGGPNYTRAVRAMELCLKTPCKAILVVTFGTIARADVMANGIIEAMQALKPEVPIVLRIRGTNEAEANETLLKAGLVNLVDTEEAVRKAVELAAGRA
ncbi:MAG: acetate--CoA ligase family protein [Mailhella sp.]|nr:acetate--CoA ligase family protein [Mailhella sp.]